MIVTTGLNIFRQRIEANSALFAGTFYMAVSTDGTAPAAGDAFLAGEQAANGLGRQAVAFQHTAGADTWTATATFTYTGSAPLTLQKFALFDAASGGNLVTEDLMAPGPVTFSASGDSVTLTVTVTA